MSTTLLIVIYLAYISLGLPDTLLGAAWPVLREELGAPLDLAGLIALVVAGGTTVSSLLSGRLLHRFGTGRVAFFSVLATALALWGFSRAGSVWELLAAAVPLGLGAGAVDAGLNNFVALRCAPKHMSFLYCFWGLGAMSGPAILSFWLSRLGGAGWRMGYRTVSGVQFALVLALGLTLPLWRRAEPDGPAAEEESPRFMGNRQALRLPGVPAALTAFLCYCSLEIATGLWTGSFLVEARGVPADAAALWGSLFYGGLAAGRVLAGLAAGRMPARRLIRLGQGLCALGAALLLLPLPLPWVVCGLGIFGLGCAPLYPAMLAETPRRFGREASQAVMGLQMAVAYFGSAVTPPLLGVVMRRVDVGLFPAFLLGAVALMAFFRERLNRSAPEIK